MGKMKEKFMEQQEQERLIREAVEAFIDDDWQYQEYLKTQGKEISQKESQANHDAWWNSLTDEQKQQLYEEQESYEKERIEREMDEIQYIEDRMDIEDEMNHDLSFGK